MPTHTSARQLPPPIAKVWATPPAAFTADTADALIARALWGILGGNGIISSALDVAGVPASRPVLLFDRTMWMLVASTRSGADGSYRFTGLNPTHRYTAIGIDDTETMNAAIADWLTPELE